jgi:hypothetical protein
MGFEEIRVDRVPVLGKSTGDFPVRESEKRLRTTAVEQPVYQLNSRTHQRQELSCRALI